MVFLKVFWGGQNKILFCLWIQYCTRLLRIVSPISWQSRYLSIISFQILQVYTSPVSGFKTVQGFWRKYSHHPVKQKLICHFFAWYCKSTLCLSLYSILYKVIADSKADTYLQVLSSVRQVYTLPVSVFNIVHTVVAYSIPHQLA